MRNHVHTDDQNGYQAIQRIVVRKEDIFIIIFSVGHHSCSTEGTILTIHTKTKDSIHARHQNKETYWLKKHNVTHKRFEIVPPHEYESEHKMPGAQEHLQVSSAILDGAQLLSYHVYSVVLPTLRPSECQRVHRENQCCLHISV